MGTGQGGPGCQVGVMEKAACSQDLKEAGGEPCRCRGQRLSRQGEEPVWLEQEPHGTKGLQRPRVNEHGGRPYSMMKMCFPSQRPGSKGGGMTQPRCESIPLAWAHVSGSGFLDLVLALIQLPDPQISGTLINNDIHQIGQLWA